MPATGRHGPNPPIRSDGSIFQSRKNLAKVREVLVAQAPKGAAADPFEQKLARERRKSQKRKDAGDTELVVAGDPIERSAEATPVGADGVAG